MESTMLVSAAVAWPSGHCDGVQYSDESNGDLLQECRRLFPVCADPESRPNGAARRQARGWRVSLVANRKALTNMDRMLQLVDHGDRVVLYGNAALATRIDQ